MSASVARSGTAGGPPAGTPSDPAPEAQLLVYTLNRARHDPAAYQAETGLPVDLSGIPGQPPLAVDPSLTASASFKAAEMANYDYFDHRSAVTGVWPNRLARDHGYPLPEFYPNNANSIESIAGGQADFLVALQRLIEDRGIDPPGHRIHLLALEPFFRTHRHVGAGLASNEASRYVRYYVIHTAAPARDTPFLTGVVYRDANGNGRYDLNEGLGGVTVRAEGSAGEAETVTGSAGGWSLAVRPGVWQVTAEGGDLGGAARAAVQVESRNVEVDFVAGATEGIVAFQPAPAGTFNVSGRLMAGGVGVGGATVSAGGVSAVTSASGSFTLVGLPAGEYTLTTTRAGYAVAPLPISVAAHRTGVDLEASPIGAGFDLQLKPTRVRSGKKARAIIRLSAKLRSTVTAAVACSDASVVSAPATVLLRRGKSSAQFRIGTTKTGAPARVTVSVTLAGVTRSAELEIAP